MLPMYAFIHWQQLTLDRFTIAVNIGWLQLAIYNQEICALFVSGFKLFGGTVVTGTLVQYNSEHNMACGQH